MPLYEYRCRDCGHRFEVLQRVGKGGEGLGCPRCGARGPAKQFSTFAPGAGSSAAEGAECGSCACGARGSACSN